MAMAPFQGVKDATAGPIMLHVHPAWGHWRHLRERTQGQNLTNPRKSTSIALPVR